MVDVIVVGAGLAGLTAAKVLKAAGKTVKLIEAGDGIGGRVRTDSVAGFLCDRGFQVLLTAYPETKRFLDYKALDLKPFIPGAIILGEKGMTKITDPLRAPSTFFSTLLSPSGTLADKLRMMALKFRLSEKAVNKVFLSSETTTIDYLTRLGFSQLIISQFFKPFLAGIFLEDTLITSSRMFEFVFKMFSEGDTSVPAGGMGMIPAQLAQGLSTDELVLNEEVIEIENMTGAEAGSTVRTSFGRSYTGRRVLIATDEGHGSRLSGHGAIPGNGVITIYFSADRAPYTRPIIALNAQETKLVNTICVMNEVSSSYAPQGKHLISVSLVGDGMTKAASQSHEQLASSVRTELSHWFKDAPEWTFLRNYTIPYALPNDKTVKNFVDPSSLKVSESCFLAGDYLLNGSIDGAMKSGRLAAEAILTTL